MTDDAIEAIRAWARLTDAIEAFNRWVEHEHGVTRVQLALLRLIDDWGGDVGLAEARARLVMHPATVGQLFDRLAARGLVDLVPDPADRRRRQIRLTEHGRLLIAAAPLGGPIRLRHVPADPDRLRRLAAALTDAIELFGLREYADDRPPDETDLHTLGMTDGESTP